MKNLKTLLFTFALATVFLSFNIAKKTGGRQQINPLIGDISFVQKYGQMPDAATDENLRIKTHLEYVENILRQKDVSHLTTKQQHKRTHLLNLLHKYWTNGIFPRNYDREDERAPCFIDKDKKICAVGYLVEQTAGRAVAEQINSKHQYDEIYEMDDNIVDAWIANSGLTKEECAMIQPNYVKDVDYISPAYGISSAVIGGFNVSLNIVNGVRVANKTSDKKTPMVGLIAGAGQVILGSLMYPRGNGGFGIFYNNIGERNLSITNIGIGTTTMIIGAWGILTHQKPKEKLTTWNIYSFPAGNSVGMGFSLMRRF